MGDRTEPQPIQTHQDAGSFVKPTAITGHAEPTAPDQPIVEETAPLEVKPAGVISLIPKAFGNFVHFPSEENPDLRTKSGPHVQGIIKKRARELMQVREKGK